MNDYLSEGFYIIENYSKQKCIVPNDVKLNTNVIDQLDTYFFMGKKNAIFSVANTIKITYSEKYAFNLQTRLL